MVNRRAKLVFRANECSRIVTILGGHSPTVIRQSALQRGRKALSLGAAYVAERDLRRILRSSGLVLVNSAWLAERYRKVAPDLVILPTSVRRAKYSFLASDRLSGATPNVLISGRISADKGVFEALDAFSGIRSEIQGAQLHVVGSGEAVDRLRDAAGRMGLQDAVTFHGWIPAGERLFSIYKNMDVLLCLSPAESLPRTVWEALAHSVLVVCTAVGGLPTTFRHEQEVLFVPPHAPRPAQEAVMRLVHDRDLRMRLIQSGYDRAKQSDLEQVVQDLVDRIAGRWPELLSPDE
jgi:glycosyltransferase involved in cell wall biosynthesis